MKSGIRQYIAKLKGTIDAHDWSDVEQIGTLLLEAVNTGRRVFICGNGGSAGNAIHLANDFIYGIEPKGNAMKVESLSANPAVLTCLGNDIGYENIFSHQLKVKASDRDVLIVLSGSGNSPNILNALQQGTAQNLCTVAVLGYGGGVAKELAKYVVHFEVDDMQISEDLQLIVGHMLMQYLNQQLKE
jgi:D-sedoheptulose 7-phosphate isomerase